MGPPASEGPDVFMRILHLIGKDRVDSVITMLSREAPVQHRLSSLQQLTDLPEAERLLWMQYATQRPRIQELFISSDSDEESSPGDHAVVECVRTILRECV